MIENENKKLRNKQLSSLETWKLTLGTGKHYKSNITQVYNYKITKYKSTSIAIISKISKRHSINQNNADIVIVNNQEKYETRDNEQRQMFLALIMSFSTHKKVNLVHKLHVFLV